MAAAKSIASFAGGATGSAAGGDPSGEGRRRRQQQQRGGGGDADEDGGEDEADVRLCSPALSANPGLLQSVTGEEGAQHPVRLIHACDIESCVVGAVQRIGSFVKGMQIAARHFSFLRRQKSPSGNPLGRTMHDS